MTTVLLLFKFAMYIALGVLFSLLNIFTAFVTHATLSVYLESCQHILRD